MSRSEKAFCKDPLVRSLCSYKIRLDAYPKGKADGGQGRAEARSLRSRGKAEFRV